MLERACYPRLVQQVARRRSITLARLERLDRDGATERDLLGFAHETHAAFTDDRTRAQVKMLIN